MIQRAAAALAKATTAAEVLDAKREATVAYDAAKVAARFAKIKDAHDTIIAACHKTQADALVIEAQAQCRLADEYDAAQERGEVQKAGGDRKSKIIIHNENNDPTVTDIGLTSKQVHEARQVRDAEEAKPGIIRKTLDECLAANKEPTHAVVKRAINPPESRKQIGSNANLGDPQRAQPDVAAVVIGDGDKYLLSDEVDPPWTNWEKAYFALNFFFHRLGFSEEQIEDLLGKFDLYDAYCALRYGEDLDEDLASEDEDLASEEVRRFKGDAEANDGSNK